MTNQIDNNQEYLNLIKQKIDLMWKEINDVNKIQKLSTPEHTANNREKIFVDLFEKFWPFYNYSKATIYDPKLKKYSSSIDVCGILKNAWLYKERGSGSLPYLIGDLVFCFEIKSDLNKKNYSEMKKQIGSIKEMNSQIPCVAYFHSDNAELLFKYLSKKKERKYIPELILLKNKWLFLSTNNDNSITTVSKQIEYSHNNNLFIFDNNITFVLLMFLKRFINVRLSNLNPFINTYDSLSSFIDPSINKGILGDILYNQYRYSFGLYRDIKNETIFKREAAEVSAIKSK